MASICPVPRLTPSTWPSGRMKLAAVTLSRPIDPRASANEKSAPISQVLRKLAFVRLKLAKLPPLKLLFSNETPDKSPALKLAVETSCARLIPVPALTVIVGSQQRPPLCFRPQVSGLTGDGL